MAKTFVMVDIERWLHRILVNRVFFLITKLAVSSWVASLPPNSSSLRKKRKQGKQKVFVKGRSVSMFGLQLKVSQGSVLFGGNLTPVTCMLLLMRWAMLWWRICDLWWRKLWTISLTIDSSLDWLSHLRGNEHELFYWAGYTIACLVEEPEGIQNLCRHGCCQWGSDVICDSFFP